MSLSPPQAVLVTGATGGLGRRAVRSLAQAGAQPIIAGRDRFAVDQLAERVGGRRISLDLARLESVTAAVEGLLDGAFGPIDVVVSSAAVQVPGEKLTTEDGYELTFQVNHLAPLALIDLLLASTRPPTRFVIVGSASHDPSRTSLPDPDSSSDLHRLASGGEADADAGMRRYATSKLLAMAAAQGLAREHPDVEFLLFDPGSMLATDLYRSQSLPIRLGMRFAGPIAARREGFSTPSRSGRELTQVALGRRSSSDVVALNYDGTTSPISPRAADPAYQAAVLRTSRELIANRLG